MVPTTFNFNKELIFGECGAFIFANITTLTISHFTKNTQILSGSVVVATLLGGSLFWLVTRLYDRKKDKNFKTHEITGDIGYFTPFAVLAGFIVYDPILYFLSQYLLKSGHHLELSIISGQVSAFLFFLLTMNLYRLILIKLKIKDL